MSVWKRLQSLGRRSQSPLTSNMPPPAPPTSHDSDETQQLALLLQEVRVNEQQLGPHHWVALASTFQDRIDAQSKQTAARPKGHNVPRYRASSSSLLPLGGLLAMAALVALSAKAPVRLLDASSAIGDSKAAPTLSPDILVPPASTGAAHQHTAKTAVTMTTSETLLAPAPPPLVKRTRSAPAPLRSVPEVPAPVTAEEQQPLVTESSTPPNALPNVVATELDAPVATKPADTFAEQLAALKTADKALKTRNIPGARGALAREFSPQLALHARALRVILACQDGSVKLGRRALADQEARYPSSPYLARMRRACGVQDDQD